VGDRPKWSPEDKVRIVLSVPWGDDDRRGVASARCVGDVDREVEGALPRVRRGRGGVGPGRSVVVGSAVGA
jgi:hypothetical protein